MAISGEMLDGKYEIVKEIGSGGMSTVYLAKDIRLNKNWAVKEISTIDKESDNIYQKGLMTEVNVLKNFDHPVLPRIVDVIYMTQSAFIVMDYIEGISLDKLIAKEGPQSTETVVKWMKSLCEALVYLHGFNPPIIHMDMKPSNIILKSDGSIKLIDFGTAKKLSTDNGADLFMLGTLGYASPEQRLGIVDERSDIYSLGATMYTLLSGRRPGGASEMATRIKELNPSVTEDVKNIMLRCMQPSPEKRFQDCREILYRLNKYKKNSKQKRRIIVSVVILAICVLVEMLFSYKEKEKDENAGKSEIMMQIGMDYFEVLGDYKESARYFEMAKELGYVDADIYKELSQVLGELDTDYEKLSETLDAFGRTTDELPVSARKVNDYKLICDVLLKYGSEIENGSEKLVEAADKGLKTLRESSDENNEYFVTFNQCIITGYEKMGDDCDNEELAKTYYGRALECCESILDETAASKYIGMSEVAVRELRKTKLSKKAELLAKMLMYDRACEVYESAEDEYGEEASGFYVEHLILLCEIEENKTSDIEKWNSEKICEVYKKGESVSGIVDDYRWKRLAIKLEPILEKGG